MAITLKSILGTIGSVAPTIAGALGGPLAGTAFETIAGALGMKGSDEKSIAEVVSKATPEQLLALKQADNEFAEHMRTLEIEVAKISAGDRDSARKREMAVKDWIPGVLAIGLTAGFFGLLSYIMMHEPPAGSRDLLNVMLGSLGTGFATMLAYYFGSSASSDTKTAAMASAIDRAK